MITIFWLIFAYLCGSIPCGLLLTRKAGHGDIRKMGSGNIGATNVLRTGDKRLAIVTLLLDILKGVAPTVLAIFYAPEIAHWVAVLAVLGHNFPLWLKLKGGKGVATTFGVLVALNPLLGLLLAFTWGITFTFSKISSLSSLVAAGCAPFFGFLMIDDASFWAVLFLSTLLIVRHHGNIKRLIAGHEAPMNLK